jgi:hypothetical protein
MVPLIILLLLLLFGGNIGYFLIFGLAHPLTFVAQVLVIVLLFLVGKKLIDRYL